MSEDQVLELKEAFSMFDQNDDGLITELELGEVCREFGLNYGPAELQAIISAVDKSGKRAVDFSDFLELCSSRMRQALDPREVKEAFRSFDLSGKGTVSSTDLK